MICNCQIIEAENNVWIISLSECIEGHMNFGPFSSSDEAKYYCKNFFGDWVYHSAKIIDYEHPLAQQCRRNLKGPPYKNKYWDFEDYKILAWRNAGFRSRSK